MGCNKSMKGIDSFDDLSSRTINGRDCYVFRGGQYYRFKGDHGEYFCNGCRKHLENIVYKSTEYKTVARFYNSASDKRTFKYSYGVGVSLTNTTSDTLSAEVGCTIKEIFTAKFGYEKAWGSAHTTSYSQSFSAEMTLKPGEVGIVKQKVFLGATNGGDASIYTAELKTE